MNREATSSTPVGPPRAPRRWKSGDNENLLLDETIQEEGSNNSHHPSFPPCRTKSREELDDELMFRTGSDDVMMMDMDQDCDDAISVGSFSVASNTRPKRHVSATDSSLSLFSVDSMRFIAPTHSFTPQDIIMMELDDDSQSFSLKGLPETKQSFSFVQKRPNAALPFATNLGLPDLHSSAVSCDDEEEVEMEVAPRKPSFQRKTSIFRPPTMASS